MDKKHADYVTDVIAAFQVLELKVHGERIAVVRDPHNEKTESGLLYIPTEGQRKESRGTVVAVGKAVDDDDVQVGTRIMYTKYAPIHFTFSMPGGEKAEVEMFHVSDIYLSY